jgi:hypothetical protein
MRSGIQVWCKRRCGRHGAGYKVMTRTIFGAGDRR